MSEDQLIDFTGDRASAEVLRRTLRAVADEHADQPLGALIREVLAGHRDVRDLSSDPEFAEMSAQGMRAHEEAWATLTSDKRAEQLRAGEAYLAGLDDELG